MELIAHRGVPDLRPENTASSFILAVESGADQIECDIQRTKDGEYVIFHDFTVDRTTDGTGKVRDKTLKELKALSAHNNMERYFGERILTLDEFLHLVPEKLMLNLEVKRDVKEEEPWETDLLRFVLERRSTDAFILASLNHIVLEHIARENRDVKLGLALDGELLELKTYLKNLPFRIYSYHPAAEYVNKSGVEFLHSLGIKVYPWIIDDKDTFSDMSECKVDGVITNRLCFLTD